MKTTKEQKKQIEDNKLTTSCLDGLTKLETFGQKVVKLKEKMKKDKG